jgi:hypothetical protein
MKAGDSQQENQEESDRLKPSGLHNCKEKCCIKEN